MFTRGFLPISTCLADVEAKEIEWLWSNRIPLGKLSLILGYPDVGKSMLTTYMAATVCADCHVSTSASSHCIPEMRLTGGYDKR